MNSNKWWAKVLRVIGIMLMGLTATFTLMGGAGTACVTLNPTGYGGKFSNIANLQWLYFIFVLGGIAIGIMGIKAVVSMIKGENKTYRFIIITLLLGTAINAVHVIVSRALRGGSMPVDAVFYTNAFTLAIFILFGLPGINSALFIGRIAPDDKISRDAIAITMFVTGLLSLTIQFLMAPTHTISGINYADVWHLSLTIIGITLIASSLLVLNFEKLHHQKEKGFPETNF